MALYDGKHLIGADLQFRELVHFHDRKHGGMHADMVLERGWEFYIHVSRQQEECETLCCPKSAFSLGMSRYLCAPSWISQGGWIRQDLGCYEHRRNSLLQKTADSETALFLLRGNRTI